MNKTIKSLLSAFLLIAFLSAGTEAFASGKTKVVNIKTSAVCGSCKARIEKALTAVDGVKAAVLSLESKVVKVKYDPDKTTPEVLRTAVSNTGYSADGVKANDEAFHKLPACCKGGAVCPHSAKE